MHAGFLYHQIESAPLRYIDIGCSAAEEIFLVHVFLIVFAVVCKLI